MLFLDIELEVDGAGAGGCYAELFGRKEGGLVICVWFTSRSVGGDLRRRGGCRFVRFPVPRC